MISASSLPLIEASIPVLRAHGQVITRRFYAQMFQAHPELKNLFNLGNQLNGTQQAALANALLAYAANIARLDAFAPVIERIAHKHASVGIAPTHYTIVGQHLLGAIRDVLGSAATPELLSAWDEAYWSLAGELIASEARLYERAAVKAGEFMTLQVSEVQHETEDVVSYYLQTSGGGSPGKFVPGQYVSVAVQLEPGLRQLRQYSLSDSPHRPYWRITVKREPKRSHELSGRISNWLHANLHAGDSLQVSAAFGDFAPLGARNCPVVMLSAGVGITPMVSALNALSETERDRPVLFAHATRSPAHHVLQRDVARAQTVLPALAALTFYETSEVSSDGVRMGRMQLDEDVIAPYRDADFQLCGPAAFMREQWRALTSLGVHPARIHREVFGPELLETLL